jgi:Diguanylate cyclase, GGDEF domain
VLTEIVATCRAALRKSDVIGRMGGEEFAILLPHAGPLVAMKVAEKLRIAIARQRIRAPCGTIDVTASFGLASLNQSVADIDTLLERADAALYKAKADGRNRCVEWQAPAEAVIPGARRRVLKAGRISFNGGHSTIDCTVRTLSEIGAGLDVISSAGVPDRFKLKIETDSFSRLSRIVAKRDKHLEVEFE